MDTHTCAHVHRGARHRHRHSQYTCSETPTRTCMLPMLATTCTPPPACLSCPSEGGSVQEECALAFLFCFAGNELISFLRGLTGSWLFPSWHPGDWCGQPLPIRRLNWGKDTAPVHGAWDLSPCSAPWVLLPPHSDHSMPGPTCPPPCLVPPLRDGGWRDIARPGIGCPSPKPL